MVESMVDNKLVANAISVTDNSGKTTPQKVQWRHSPDPAKFQQTSLSSFFKNNSTNNGPSVKSHTEKSTTDTVPNHQAPTTQIPSSPSLPVQHGVPDPYNLHDFLDSDEDDISQLTRLLIN